MIQSGWKLRRRRHGIGSGLRGREETLARELIVLLDFDLAFMFRKGWYGSSGGRKMRDTMKKA